MGRELASLTPLLFTTGMLLTVSDIGTTQLSICGPKNTAAFIEALRYFVARHDC